MPNPDFFTRSQAGIHGSKQRNSCMYLPVGSRLRGNGAAVPLLTPHVQQSRAIARTFAPVTSQ